MNLKKLYNTIPDKWVRLILFYAFSLAFIIANAWLVLKMHTLVGFVIPIAFTIIIVAVFSYDKLIWLIIFLTPLSVQLRRLPLNMSFDMHVPTEIIMGGIILLILVSLARGKRFNKQITLHPVSLILYLYLAWMLISTIASTLPIVSIKYLFIHFMYIMIFYFLLAYIFYNKNEKIEKLIWLYTIAFIPVIIYTVIRHSAYGLYDDNAAHWVMQPFFGDHTSYGAALAMFIPFLLGFVFSKWMPKKHRIVAAILLVFFVIAEILSFTRAAWLSLFAAACVWIIMKLRIKFRTIMIVAVTFVAILFAFQNQILQKIEQNSTDSSNNLMDHFSSMTNITTDDSNLERLNRWQCAISMFKEKPVFGWGPGTYAMNYAPFQLTSQRTKISTNSGDGGNAHSEYLGALSEMGMPGMILFMIILGTVLYTGINAYSRTNNKRTKTLIISAIIALITYYIHAFLNNFLDTDKIGVPFWGFTAIIVALDIYTRNEQTKLKIEKTKQE